MKTAEIVPRTVVYASTARAYRDPDRIVVLSTTVHQIGSERTGPDEQAVSLRPAAGAGFRKMDWAGAGRGLPVLVASRYHDPTATNDELLAAAAALPEILDGPLPSLPELIPAIHFRVMRPQDIGSTWSDHADTEARGVAARAEYLAVEAALAAEERRVRIAVLALLDTYRVPAQALHTIGGRHGEGSVRVDTMEWSELHGLLSELLTAATRAARHDPLRVDDGRWHEVTQTNWEA